MRVGTKRGHEERKLSGEVGEDGLTFCIRAPAVCNDNEDVIALERDSDRVGRKIGPTGVAPRLRGERACDWYG